MSERIASITLDDSFIIRRTPEIEHERAIAIADLLEENHFAPTGSMGPYALHLRVADNRLLLEISPEQGVMFLVTLPLAPFRGIIRDYFMICESYFEAIKSASPYKIEAIDMGRRGIHNEGADMLVTLLKEKIRLDSETARRLFTLICVLHIK